MKIPFLYPDFSAPYIQCPEQILVWINYKTKTKCEAWSWKGFLSSSYQNVKLRPKATSPGTYRLFFNWDLPFLYAILGFHGINIVNPKIPNWNFSRICIILILSLLSWVSSILIKLSNHKCVIYVHFSCEISLCHAVLPIGN